MKFATTAIWGLSLVSVATAAAYRGYDADYDWGIVTADGPRATKAPSANAPKASKAPKAPKEPKEPKEPKPSDAPSSLKTPKKPKASDAASAASKAPKEPKASKGAGTPKATKGAGAAAPAASGGAEFGADAGVGAGAGAGAGSGNDTATPANGKVNIPTRVGAVIALSAPSQIAGIQDMGNKEYDRGHACNSDADTGSENAVFIVADGGTLSNVIIGANSLEGVHCEGACSLINVWFRDVCEDAITLKGTGTVLIKGGGAVNAKDKVVQANGRGTTTILDYTVSNVGKVYRSCGNCSKNGGPRNVIIEGLKAYGVTADVIGINTNYGDSSNITASCGTGVKKVCQEFTGVDKTQGKSESPKLSSTANCKGLATLPAC